MRRFLFSNSIGGRQLIFPIGIDGLLCARQMAFIIFLVSSYDFHQKFPYTVDGVRKYNKSRPNLRLW